MRITKSLRKGLVLFLSFVIVASWFSTAFSVNTYASNSSATPLNQPVETVYSDGTDVTFDDDDDGNSNNENEGLPVGALPIGFNFSFYGTSYTSIYASSNGQLWFANDGNYILPFEDDLYLRQYSKVMYETIGSAPNRKFVIQYTNMKFYSPVSDYGGDALGTFQAILYENNNEIQLQYPNLIGTHYNERAFGSNAVIGIQKSGNGSLYYSDETESLTEKQAIRFSPDSQSSYAMTGQASYDPILLKNSLFPNSSTLISPTDGGTASLHPTFHWNNVIDASSYRLLIATDPKFKISPISSIVKDQSGIIDNFIEVNGLQDGTQYYWKVAAINNDGYYTFSNTYKFTAYSILPATIETDANANHITSTTATVGGNVTSDGDASVTERGVVYSINANPTISDGKVAAASGGTGSYSVNLTGLQSATTYHIRAYATNEVGTSYGSDVTFTTLSSNASLAALSLDGITLDQTVKENVYAYTASVPNNVTVTSVTYITADSLATVGLQLNGTPISNPINLNVGQNAITILVTAQDNSQTAYTVNVTRISNNVLLSNLAVDQGTLSPVFSSAEPNYTVNVSNDVTSLKLFLTKGDLNQTLTVTDATYISVTNNVYAYNVPSLNVGANSIQIVISAQDGTSSPYQLTVNRARRESSSSVGGGGGSSTTLITSTDGKLTLPVGKTGEVSLENAITINIPANATDKELKLTIEKVLDSQKLLTNKVVLASPIFEILKNFSENFSNPVTLTFVFDPKSVQSNQRASVFYYDEVNKAWVEVKGGKTNENHITVEVNHLTKYAVLVVDQTTGLPVTGSADIVKEINFSDIAGHWAGATIKQAVNVGIVTGYPDGTFKPNHTVTRAEFAVMLMNALKPQGEGATLTFTDKTTIGAWAQKAVAQAVQAGMIKGYEDETFRPDAEITRAEMAVMLANAAGSSVDANEATGFADDKNVPAWAKGSVAFVKQAGIVQGKDDNAFAPQDHATRAEAVTVLLNMLTKKSK